MAVAYETARLDGCEWEHIAKSARGKLGYELQGLPSVGTRVVARPATGTIDTDHFGSLARRGEEVSSSPSLRERNLDTGVNPLLTPFLSIAGQELEMDKLPNITTTTLSLGALT